MGQLLQFGFINRASNYQGSGIFYDNVAFRERLADSDGDQVLDEFDVCPGTNLVTEEASTPAYLLPYLYWTRSDGRFLGPKGRDSGFTVVSTHGCSASQIVARLAGGNKYEQIEAQLARLYGLTKWRLSVSSR